MVGLEKLELPLKPSELNADNITKYLPTIMQALLCNREKIKNNYNIYKGCHDILTKTRKYDDDSAINNKVVEQHLWTMVNFKCGYIYGNPLEFAEKGTQKTEQMKVFNNYLISTDFRTKLDNVIEYVYSTGVGYLFVEPTISEDKQNIAPFKVIFVESENCFKVYSSYLGKEPLFDIIITPILKEIATEMVDYYVISIYTPNAYFEYECEQVTPTILANTKIEERTYNLLPLIEFYAYQDRIGIVESCVSMQDALDRIDSNTLDNIDDFVNQMLIIHNASLGETADQKAETLKDAKRNGVLEIFDTTKDIQAEVKTLTVQLNNADTNIYKNKLQADMYASWGVPLASSSISSGNVTASGGEVANGWEHAYSVALKENNQIVKALNDFIKHILYIAKITPDTPITDLNLTDIEIKYNIARSNNLQVKTQSFTYLVEHNVPYDIAWATCELSGDPKAIGKAIQENADRIAEEQKQAQAVLSKQDNGGANQNQL